MGIFRRKRRRVLPLSVDPEELLYPEAKNTDEGATRFETYARLDETEAATEASAPEAAAPEAPQSDTPPSEAPAEDTVDAVDTATTTTDDDEYEALRASAEQNDDDATDESTSMEVELAPKLEQAVITLAVHAQQIDTRLDRLEDAIGRLADRTILSNTELEELLDVRVQSARTAANMMRLSDELHEELAQLAAKVNEMGDNKASRNRMVDLAKQIIDLSDSYNESPTEIVESGKLSNSN